MARTSCCLLAVIALGGLFAVGCGGGAAGGPDGPYAGAIRSRDVARGEEIFLTLCTVCHDGRVNPQGYAWSPARMRRQVREGNHLMPPIPARRVSPDDLEAVLAYLTTVDAVDGDLPPLPRAPAPPEIAPPAPALEVREIAIDGDGRVMPLALAEHDGGVVLFTAEPAGIGRLALDLETSTARRAETIPLDARPTLAAYDAAHDRLVWVRPEAQREALTSLGGNPAAVPRTMTLSTALAHGGGLRATIRVCPTGRPTRLAVRGDDPPCDHQVHVILPLEQGTLLAGQLDEQPGTTNSAAWLGHVGAEGTLTVERRVPPDMHPSRVDALARSEAGVLAVSWSGRESARAMLTLLREPTLEVIQEVALPTPSATATPWSAALPTADGGFLVVLTRTRDELVIIAVSREGAVTGEHAIAGASLPTGSTQALGQRGGTPWLAIADPSAQPQPFLRLLQIDPSSGAVPVRHEVALPAGFEALRILATERGFLVAGRVAYERPLVVFVPLTGGAQEAHVGDALGDPTAE